MIAFKFLRAGSIGPFTGFRWKRGEWVETEGPVPCRRGIHACLARDLPYWLRGELWEIELDGEIAVGRFKLVAERGRLVRRVEAWNDAAYLDFATGCCKVTRALAEAHAEDERVRRIAADAETVLGRGHISLVPYFASVAAGRAGGDAARAAERERQAGWLAEHVL